MKKISLLVAVSPLLINFLFCLPTKAQFKKGTLMMGATLGTTAYSDANSDYNFGNGNNNFVSTHLYTLNLGPQIGVFVSPTVVIGGTLSFNFKSSNVATTNNSSVATLSGGIDHSTTTLVMLEPMMRYYFAGSPKKNWFFMEFHGGIGTGSGTSSGSGYTATTTDATYGKVRDQFEWNAGFGPGMTHFFSPRWGMDFLLGYTYSHSRSDNTGITYTTVKRTGVVRSAENNYILTTGTNGISFSVGFHRFL